MYFDADELLNEVPIDTDKKAFNEEVTKLGLLPKEHRSDGLRIITGETLLDNI
jgi:hypothetical protein